MVSDGSSFLRRAQLFLAEVQAGKFPNATTLIRSTSCSANTAQRVIDRLRNEYLVPIEYDRSQKGYFLKDPNFIFPARLPPGKDELAALLLARDLVRSIDAPELHDALDSLWRQYTIGNSLVCREIGPLSSIFSSQSTEIATIVDTGLLEYLEVARSGESVQLLYKSPWNNKEPQTYEGKIERVHVSDGALYLLFREASGRAIIFNASFVRKFQILDYTVHISSIYKDPDGAPENWFEGYGVWSGEQMQDLVVEIFPPAAEYYARQRWHSNQEDTWDGDVLVRRFPGIVSPEVSRRILSLGRHVRDIQPPELKQLVIDSASALLRSLNDGPHPRSGVGD